LPFGCRRIKAASDDDRTIHRHGAGTYGMQSLVGERAPDHFAATGHGFAFQASLGAIGQPIAQALPRSGAFIRHQFSARSSR
jgi:hypothetical protein